MDFLFIIVMFVIFTIIDNLAGRKKPRVPPPQNRDGQPNFDIPTLANDPNLPGEEIPMIVEIPRPAEIRPRSPQEYFAQRQQITKQDAAQVVRDENQSPELNLEFTPSTIMNGFILSELLDKPKALRRRR
ncbi:MAG: hypothetical protein IJ685_05750 [Selenomonadaceae bacterium]|nr:hypothetical protein [Selenomonadaceae bacterium]